MAIKNYKPPVNESNVKGMYSTRSAECSQMIDTFKALRLHKRNHKSVKLIVSARMADNRIKTSVGLVIDAVMSHISPTSGAMWVA